jgi:hypothetical protein
VTMPLDVADDDDGVGADAMERRLQRPQ